MANEQTLRSYRDYDAYDRGGAAADTVRLKAGGDPLAELARIMGQDDAFADLLKQAARSGGAPRIEPVMGEPVPAAAEAAAPVDETAYAEAEDEAATGEPLELPAMPLRGAAGEPAVSDLDWEDLEAELENYARSAGDLRGAIHEADDGIRHAESVRGPSADWAAGSDPAATEALLREFEETLAGAVEPRGGAAAPVSEPFDYADGRGLAVAGGLAAAGTAAALAVRCNEAAEGLNRHPQAAVESDIDEAYEEDAPPRRRRAGVTAVVAVVGLAVLGGAGAYGYRAMSGGGAGAREVRVIQANSEPIRVPAQQNQAAKPVTDRVPGAERVVPREERPVTPREQAAQVQEPPAPRVIPLSVQPQAAPAQPQTAGTVVDPGLPPVRNVQAAPIQPASAPEPAPRSQAAEEPRRVRTVQIGPDGQVLGSGQRTPGALPLSVVPAAPAPAPQAAAAIPQSPPVRAAEPQPAASAPALAAVETRTAPAPQPRPAAASRPAQPEPQRLSVQPQAQPRAGGATPLDIAPQRTASLRTPAPATTAAAGSGTTFVQISSHQSEREALGAFAAAQRRFPMLQGQAANVRAAEIPGRGTWHRLRVGPFSRAEAQDFCTRLKAAGGSCVIN